MKLNNFLRCKFRYGVGIVDGRPIDMLKTFVWEPSQIKRQAIRAATEAAVLILSVDHVLILPQVVGHILSRMPFLTFTV